jgi:hypothetical protein
MQPTALRTSEFIARGELNTVRLHCVRLASTFICNTTNQQAGVSGKEKGVDKSQKRFIVLSPWEKMGVLDSIIY